MNDPIQLLRERARMAIGNANTCDARLAELESELVTVKRNKASWMKTATEYERAVALLESNNV